MTTYIDDVLIHSANEEEHKHHLSAIFSRLKTAGLTLRGRKCQIGMPQVTYLGHVFCAAGVTPDETKVKAVMEWPTPSSATEVRQFLDLASYYRKFICHFSDIAAPHKLTQKDNPFFWTADCEAAFRTLKSKLTSATVLTYPRFDKRASHFVLQTDARAIGLGAILQQDGYVIGYATRVLSKSEANYSVIQRECLALVYGMKQFRHYLLGRPFQLWTDHEPLQWLSGQKMKGLLCRWALALQEYDFRIVYRKASLNTNADALSRRKGPELIATTRIDAGLSTVQIHEAQRSDEVLSQLYRALKMSQRCPNGGNWRRPPLRRYNQLWSQLILKDNVVCRQYTPGPTSETITVPVLPKCLHREALLMAHDSSMAGHQGVEKTLDRLRHSGYWFSMLQDVEQHCQQGMTCQKHKPTAPMRAPLVNVPIGKPWQMVAVDILEVPVSPNNNRYLLEIQDYFTKWAEARPLPDQTAARITHKLMEVFTNYGFPDIVHSDQGRNFESTVFHQTLEAFGVHKSRTTAYHPQGDGLVE